MSRLLIRAGFTVMLAWLGLTEVSGQTVQLSRVMREKLQQSQGLLAALVTSDWGDLERRSRQLEVLTRDPAWAVMNAPEYTRHAAAFLRATQDLIEAAQRRDPEGAPLAYVSLTLTCVRCHQMVARARLAGSMAVQPASRERLLRPLP
ncbi:MAG TPA: hypothetical protein VIK60_12840 [Vicinamibacterales bacterium]